MEWASGFGAAAFGVLLGLQTAIAAVTPEEASRLGSDLPPVGAEKAGNAAGTIPAWEGGLTALPAGVTLEKGKHVPDPFAGDQRLSQSKFGPSGMRSLGVR